MRNKETLDTCKQWIAGNISNNELRDETDCTFTDEELDYHYVFIGGDPVLAQTHAEILCDAITASHKMPLAAFQATRKPATAAEMAATSGIDIGEETSGGFVYCNVLSIELTDGWRNVQPAGKYYLLIERSEYLSNDLAELERILWLWALGEGYADTTEQARQDLFRQRLDEFATAASLLNGAWYALDSGESKGYPFAKDFESITLDIIRWNQTSKGETK